jgi:SAM-dependent methyltransferase
MGCGKGLTSVFLAKEYDVTVFANDLWISATDNLRRFEEAGVADKVYPIHAEAHALPYAEGFFDVAISIDSYHYYGAGENYFPDVFAKLVKPGGQFGIVVPGLVREFEKGYPDTMEKFWKHPEMFTFHSKDWWRKLWEKTGLCEITACYDIENPKEIWRGWAEWADRNKDADFGDAIVDIDDTSDVEFLAADTGDDIALIVMAARKRT